MDSKCEIPSTFRVALLGLLFENTLYSFPSAGFCLIGQQASNLAKLLACSKYTVPAFE